MFSCELQVSECVGPFFLWSQSVIEQLEAEGKLAKLPTPGEMLREDPGVVQVTSLHYRTNIPDCLDSTALISTEFCTSLTMANIARYTVTIRPQCFLIYLQ